MKGWGLLFVAGFGAVLAWRISENTPLFYAVLAWLGTLATMVLTGVTLAMVMRYSRSREASPRPASPSPTSYIIDQPGPYQALPAPRREPVDSGRLEMLPTHFTDTVGDDADFFVR